jgi:hypothetical protein
VLVFSCELSAWTMARPGRKQDKPEMVLTVLRTAFPVYVRVLLSLQGLFLGFWAWTLWPGRAPHGLFWPWAGLALVFGFLGLAEIVTAVMLRRGRRRAAVAAIIIEALWAAVPAALSYKTLKDWPFNWPLLQELAAGAALFLAAAAGLLLRPVRTYAGLVRH